MLPYFAPFSDTFSFGGTSLACRELGFCAIWDTTEALRPHGNIENGWNDQTDFRIELDGIKAEQMERLVQAIQEVLKGVLLVTGPYGPGSSRASATFKDGTVTVRNSLLGIGTSKQVSYSDILQVTSPDASQSGQGTEAIPAYAIYLETSSQGTVPLGFGLRNAGEAGYLVERIKAEIKIPPMAIIPPAPTRST